MMKHYNNFILSSKAVQFNVNKIRSCLQKQTKLCAMVKANAYGHGMEMVRLLSPWVDCFGVASVAEAKQIRRLKISIPILVVGLTDPDWVLWCSKNNVSVTVHSQSQLEAFAKKLKQYPLKIHFKINTGLNRIGFQDVSTFVKAYAYACGSSCFIPEGIFTHFATKEAQPEFIEKQHREFLTYVEKTKRLTVHCCNSYATLHFPQFQHDMVRCGFALYGWEKGFVPVATITATVLAVQPVLAGETVGYDRTYRYEHDGRIAVVSMGYADGFDRRNSNVSSVLVCGQEVPVVGLVCMDIFLIDVTSYPDIQVGSMVTVLGGSGDLVRTPQYYATQLNTSPYEILLKFNHRRMNVLIQ